LSRLEVRENIEEEFGKDWFVTNWDNDYAVLKELKLNEDQAAVVYINEAGFCGLVQCFEESSLLSDMSVFLRFQNTYVKRREDENLLLRLLQWDEQNNDIIVLVSSFIEEEFDEQVKEHLFSRFEDFMRIVKGLGPSR
jgi:hypothetical protein